MEKFVLRLIIPIALCLPLFLYSYPTRKGIRGLNNLISATNDGAGHMNFISDIYGSGGGIRNENFWLTADASIGFGFAFTDWFSVNLFSQYMADVLDSTDNQHYISYGPGDLEIGVKVTPSIFWRKQNGEWDIGLFPSICLPIGAKPNEDYPDTVFGFYLGQGGIYRYFTAEDIDYGGKFLISYTANANIPIEFDGNIGYFTHNKNRKGDMLSYGFGIGFLYENFVPYIEISGSECRDSDMGPRLFYLTPGIKLGKINNASVNLALNFRVDGHVEKETKKDEYSYISVGERVTPSWSFNLSYARGFSFYHHPPSPPTISGMVIDAETKERLSAMIILPDTVIETDAMGNYTIQARPGNFVIRAFNEGYMPQDQNVFIEPGEKLLISFELEKTHVPMAEIAGTVIDRLTKIPLVAEISFPEIDIEPFVTDETGVFKLKLPPDTHIVRITAEGYIPYATPILLKDKETVLKDFYLLKEYEKITLQGINFTEGSAEIDPIYYSILDEGAKLLREYPNIRVEIRGYTDNLGSAEANLILSQRRAESVRSHLIKIGIEASRLRAVGYGEAMPISTNDTEEGRAQNRRIEFYILGE